MSAKVGTNATDINALELIRQVVENINGQILAIDMEVLAACESENPQVLDHHSNLQQCCKLAQVMALFEHIHAIRTQGECAAAVVNAANADAGVIVALGNSGDTLRKAKKLVASVNELESELTLVEFDYYRTVAELITDIFGQMAEFECYAATPYFRTIKAKVALIETELRRQVQWTVREIGQLVAADPDINPNAPSPDITVDMDSLSQVYLLVDALSIRKDLLERFTQLQLLPYEKAFKMGTKYAGMEGLEKRFVWFRHLLRVMDEKLPDVFPRSWRVPYYLFLEFSRRTKKHLMDVLESEKVFVDARQHVSGLLAALKVIITFQAEMKASFEVASRGEDDSSQDPASSNSFEIISDAFDDYLGPYVQLERDGLEELMDELVREEDEIIRSHKGFTNDDGSLQEEKGIYDSSRQMFEYIKTSLKRCTTFSTGITYLNLSKEFRICLHNYAESLKFRCPSPVSAKAGKPPVYVISAREEVALCRIVCSGEYCMDTIPPLEAIMKERINPIYKDEIDFSSQIDVYMSMISFTIGVMAAGVTERLEPALKTMREVKWQAVEVVGDDSRYAKDIRAIFNDVIPRTRSLMSTCYFQNFCMKLSTNFLEHLLATVWKLKRITKTGGGQLLLDLNGIKTYLLRLPHARLAEDAEAPAISKAYISQVNNKINKIEVILKLVCTDEANLEEMFGLLWPEGQPTDLEAIVNLKARVGALPVQAMGKVQDIISDGAKTVVGHETYHNTSKGFKTAFGDVASVVFTGNLFDDGAKSTPNKGGGGSASKAGATSRPAQSTNVSSACTPTASPTALAQSSAGRASPNPPAATTATAATMKNVAKFKAAASAIGGFMTGQK